MTMNTKTPDPITAARELLERGDYFAAHQLLARECKINPGAVEFRRIANLILPCRMFEAARKALRSLEMQKLIDPPPPPTPLEEYQQNKPFDQDIGLLVTA